ncbi:hypothetical protein AX16_008217, partial [Volvariella volvacea WC 439]
MPISPSASSPPAISIQSPHATARYEQYDYPLNFDANGGHAAFLGMPLSASPGAGTGIASSPKSGFSGNGVNGNGFGGRGEERDGYRFTSSPAPLSDDGEEDDDQVEQQHAKRRRVDGALSDEESEEDDDEEEEDEDDEDEEPTLKYERITGAVPDLLKKDSAAAVTVANGIMALGTHAGIIHVMDLTGKRIKSYKPHVASIMDISLDATADFVATASMDGQTVVHSLSTPESYTFDVKRPMRTIAMEPNFAKKGTRAFVSGGLAGDLILREKGWLGHKETLLHAGEGPIWQVRWRGRLIAWANDYGVKIYDTHSQSRITFIDRPPNSPRADLFKCTLHWQDDSTLLIAWADQIKVCRIRHRPKATVSGGGLSSGASGNQLPLLVEVTQVFEVDGMISGIVPHPTPTPAGAISQPFSPVQSLSTKGDEAPTVEGSEKDDASINAKGTIGSASIRNNTTRSSTPSKRGQMHVQMQAQGQPSAGSQPQSPAPSSAAASLPPISASIPPPPPSSQPTLAPAPPGTPSRPSLAQTTSQIHPITLTSFLILAYTPPESFYNEKTEDKAQQARKLAERPELRIISRAGEEIASDALTVAGFQTWSCNDYQLVEVDNGAGQGAGGGGLGWGLGLVGGGGGGAGGASQVNGVLGDQGKWYVVMSPKDLVLVKPRDKRDHVAWLLERERYEEALDEVEKIEAMGGSISIDGAEDGLKAKEIGQRYVTWLVEEGDFVKAARLCPKVCGGDTKRWETWIFKFAGEQQLETIMPYVPIDSPRLDHLVYEMMLAHYLAQDRQMLLKTIKEWPREIYDIGAVIVAVQAELDRTATTSNHISSTPRNVILMECLAELYTANRQPGKALPYFLRLRRPNVFELIRENNLFTDVQDQVLLLVEFDHELRERRKKGALSGVEGRGEAIMLLVDQFHSIPIEKVVKQLKERPNYLFHYLDAMFEKDPHLVANFADLQVRLFAEYAPPRLIDFLRASSSYNLEWAYKECMERDLVTEMVFLLGRMGNNKQALMLIIERLGDVYEAIGFAKQQNDDDLWEDLLMYSETRPAFIRGLLENVGPEIEPIRLIRRIKNGLEIPGLKEALIKILQDFNLQISLLEGCQEILNGDGAELGRVLQKNQQGGFLLGAKSKCQVCGKALIGGSQGLALLYLCRHVVHASCAKGGDTLPHPPDLFLRSVAGLSDGSEISGKIAYEAVVRSRLKQGCP